MPPPMPNSCQASSKGIGSSPAQVICNLVRTPVLIWATVARPTGLLPLKSHGTSQNPFFRSEVAQVTFLTRLLWAWQTPSFLDSTSASPAHNVRARDPLGTDSFPHARHSSIYLLMQAFVILSLIAYYVSLCDRWQTQW